MKSLPAPGSRSGGPTPRPSPNVGGVVWLGLLVSIVFVAGAIAWASYLPLTSAAIAEGTVTADGNVKSVQHLEGGIIEEILVENGKQVEAGQILMVLDDAQSRASWKLVSGRYVNLRVLEARLLAERDELEAIALPEDIDVDVSLRKLTEILAAQRLIFEARRESLTLRRNILNERINQLNSQVASLKKQVVSHKKQIALISEEVVDVKKMVDKGLERRPRLLKLQREAARLTGVRDQTVGKIAETEQRIGETRLQILNVSTEHRDEVVRELREVQVQLDDVNEQRQASFDILERSIITAPVAGVVENLAFFTPGGVIASGDRILDIVPVNDELIVEAKISPVDIDVVVTGLEAKLTLSAFKQRVAPVLDGKVSYVSANREEDRRTGEQFYTARIRIPAEELERLGDLILVQGMPVQAMIVTGESTFLNYVLQPVKESFQRAFRQS